MGGAINKVKEARLRKRAPLPDHRLYRAAVTVVPASYDETLARLREIFLNHLSSPPPHSTGGWHPRERPYSEFSAFTRPPKRSN